MSTPHHNKADAKPDSQMSSSAFAETLRASVVDYVDGLGLPNGDSALAERPEKERVRQLHSDHRSEAARRERSLYRRSGQTLLELFAEGEEVDPRLITPEIVAVKPGTVEGDLFRVATLLWSVPVSRGYGRRMRFIIRDSQNGKLVGILALGSPVFNLQARDEWVGWTSEDRRHRLTSVMDAYVVGAVPPYAQLIGGKLIAALAASREIGDLFAERYRGKTGIIRGVAQNPELVLVTTTSALGRSSLYNRLKLDGLVDFRRLGQTEGYGHFHIPDHIFNDMRTYLELIDHGYASGHQYGSGPNWRMRAVREALKALGLDQDLLRHGIRREVFALARADNWRAYLRRETDRPRTRRVSAADIAEAAKNRWVVARSERRPEFRSWKRSDTQALLERNL